nr:MAG TPA: hypothetical protein [Bacteriophage sp.]
MIVAQEREKWQERMRLLQSAAPTAPRGGSLWQGGEVHERRKAWNVM